ncbi:hypothetical protein WME94_16870 [Sorangium sp. So ce429]
MREKDGDCDDEDERGDGEEDEDNEDGGNSGGPGGRKVLNCVERPMHPTLQAVVELLERPEVLEPETTVRGLLGEQLVAFSLRASTNGSWTYQWTEATAGAPAGLILHLRPASRGAPEPGKRQPAADRVAPDPRFDTAFVVEGAPKRLVTRLLDDPELRRSLLALEAGEPPGWLTARNGAAPHRPNTPEEPSALVRTRRPKGAPPTEVGLFAVQISGWTGVERAALLLRTTARLGALSAEIALDERTSGYRGQGTSSGPSEDEAELREFDLRFTKKKDARELAGCLVGGAVLLVLASIALFVLWLLLVGAGHP